MPLAACKRPKSTCRVICKCICTLLILQIVTLEISSYLVRRRSAPPPAAKPHPSSPRAGRGIALC